MGQVSPTPKFRIKFDVPHSYAIEPGYVRDQHCRDIRVDAASMVNTWQDPITGLISLNPSFKTGDFYTSANWHPLTDWLHNADFWDKCFSNINIGGAAAFFTTLLKDALSTGGLLPGLRTIATAAINKTSPFTNDILHWVLQSNFNMPADGGFVWHFHALADEKHQYKNWFALQFDDLALHFSHDGTVGFYQYQNGLTNAPTLLDQREIATPGDIANKAGYFIVIPIPGQGLNVYHGMRPQKDDHRASSASSGGTPGVQFRMARKDATSGQYYVHKGGKMSVAIGADLTLVQHKIGYHAITYPTGTNVGTFTDGIFDMGYQPTHVPNAISQPSLLHGLNLAGGSATLTVQKADNSGVWAPAADAAHPAQQARAQIQLSNTDANHTPFVSSYYVQWDPLYATRATTAIQPDILWALEFTDTDLGEFEGICETLATTDAYRKICERGDTTFQIEKSLDGGTTWVIHNGGLAQLSDPVEVYLDNGRISYAATWKLVGQEGRFKEAIHMIFGALDGGTPGAAINKILLSCAEPIVASLPAGVTAFNLPAPLEGQNFRFAPKIGEAGDEIIRDMLLLCRSQFVEYRCYYSWATGGWIIDAKPRDTTAGGSWTLTPFPDEGNLAARYVVMSGNGDGRSLFTFHVEPPEGNIVQSLGASSPESLANTVPGTAFVNFPSINDPTSVDYLGRTKIESVVFAPFSEVGTVNIMGRRVYDASAFRRLQPIVPGREYVDALKPGLQVYLRCQDASGTRGWFATPPGVGGGAPVPVGFWLKRRTVAIRYHDDAGEQAPRVTYTLDTVWESDMK